MSAAGLRKPKQKYRHFHSQNSTNMGLWNSLITNIEHENLLFAEKIILLLIFSSVVMFYSVVVQLVKSFVYCPDLDQLQKKRPRFHRNIWFLSWWEFGLYVLWNSTLLRIGIQGPIALLNSDSFRKGISLCFSEWCSPFSPPPPTPTPCCAT